VYQNGLVVRGVGMRSIRGSRTEPTHADAEFRAFFDREVVGQVRRATLLLGSKEQANDVVQEALARIYERWESLDHPGSYLNTTVLNLCRDAARRRSVDRRITPQLVPTEPAPTEPEILDDVLLSLPFNQRAAVVLRYWGGLSTTEISDELGCAPGSVGPWIDRALKTMRKALS